MVKALLKKTNDPDEKGVLFLGLSQLNLDLLMEGKPILIEPEGMKKLIGWEGKLAIGYGVTEEAIVDELQKKFGN